MEPTNSIFVVAPRNVLREEEFFLGMVVKIITVSRYLGGCVGVDAAEENWLAGKF